MGRMAEARKRARRPGGGARPPSGSPAPAYPPRVPSGEAEAASAGRPLKLPPSGLAEDVLGSGPRAAGPEEARAEATPGSPPEAPRIALPPSGLASDVLSRLEAAAVAPEPTASEPQPASPALSIGTPPSGAAGAHSLSFFTAPAREQRAAAEATEHLATFFLEEEEYGVDVRQVQEIRRVGEITAVPRAPEFVRGVINLRGRILPVLDLKRKLGLGDVAEGRAARIVVVRVRERLLGLLVDGASQVLKVPVSRVEPPPDEVIERGGDYIRGVAKLDDRLIILIDLARALAQEIREAGAVAET
jgi:purine-binding chemotaxis protein CheW